MPRIDVDGGKLHYQQTGEGPDVVLIHAFTSNLAVWMMIGIMDELAKDFRVTSYDLRGHGLSEVTPNGYNSAAMAPLGQIWLRRPTLTTLPLHPHRRACTALC